MARTTFPTITLSGGIEKIPRIPVSSTNVMSVGYYPVKQILEVEFIGGRIYQYFDVPIDDFIGLINAPSKGEYINDWIKDSYDYVGPM